MNIACDFLGDWYRMVFHELQQLDPSIDPTIESNDLCICYVNWWMRQIAQRPRTVHVAPELQCPTGLVAGFEALKDKIRVGDDLTPHLSWRLESLSFNDGLLNDWGIYHLHLGMAPDGKKPAFVERTKEVLMARFDERNAYLIEIVPHQQWTRQRLLEIIHRNWPDTIANYRLPGRVAHTFTDQEHAQLRKAGVLTLIEVDGVGYIPPGGGITTSGVGVRVVDTCNRIVHNLRDYEAQLKANATEVAETFRRHGINVGETLELTMQTDGKTVWAVAQTLDAAMELGPLVR